jgi:hypothetical protein
MPASMRDVSRLGWLQGRLWGLTFAALVFVLYGMMPWRSAPNLSFRYIWLSHAGVLTTAKVEGSEGWTYPLAAYSFATPDGARHLGKAARRREDPDELLVYYLPRDPDVSTPRNQWFELEQLVVVVLVVASCATSILVRFRRRPA